MLLQWELRKYLTRTMTRIGSLLVIVLASFSLAAVGCRSSAKTGTKPPLADAGGAASDLGRAAADAGGGEPPDPLAPLPDASQGLTNVAADLDALLEHGALAGACDRYFNGATDDKSRLLCGKSMFFYESFGTGGVPASLVQFLVQNFPNQIGPGFAQLGMVPDPSSTDHYPLGLAPTKAIGTAPALAFTCASCHFARLPDGRYAVGAPNHAYQYGKQILSLVVLPALALGGNASAHDPAAVAAVQPLLDAIKADSSLSSKLLTAVLPLAGNGMMPGLSMENEHHYATWASGTMDFLIQPLPVDDTVHTISKISPLWSLPSPAELSAAHLDSAWLGWTGGTASVMDFLHGFVSFGGGPAADWTDARLQPLADYVYSLRPPANPSPPDPALADKGRILFGSAGCISCHDGPRGSGRTLFDFGQIGTDDAMRNWLDPTGKGMPCCNLPGGAKVTLTHQLKSPRLVGEWAMQRFLHNGALSSLDELFCRVPRPTTSEAAFGAQGHDMACALSDADKQALEAYLLAH
jgi:hypothetical protein